MNPTKEHIILTAFRLFLQKGYKEVTMSMLVKSTGLSKGAFYHYFENKEQLFIETLDNLFFSISPFNQEMIINPEVSFYEYMKMYIDNVKKMAKMITSYVGADASGMGYYRLMLDVANYAPDFHKKIESSNKNELAFWKKIVQYGINKGEIKDDLDIETLANQFQWLQDGIALNSIFSSNPHILYSHLEKAFEQLYYCIKK
ncbi:MAG TPA: TetR/AcrR family transcriptional regulator [Bacteroidales bacterium]|jgi:AcrR family transcriptional regulator|nr:TetR/AcrR family transcriptional regulator [Bacteroidales bacterium]